jgi:hypothetical protein
MFVPTKGKFHCGTDTYIHILAVYHVDETRAKVKAMMVNKSNGIVYPIKSTSGWGQPANITLELKNIQHWTPYTE